MNEPLHIRPPWQKVAARLQHEARKTQGYAIIKATILVNQDGNPIAWLEPEIKRIEPKGAHDLLEVLAEG